MCTPPCPFNPDQLHACEMQRLALPPQGNERQRAKRNRNGGRFLGTRVGMVCGNQPPLRFYVTYPMLTPRAFTSLPPPLLYLHGTGTVQFTFRKREFLTTSSFDKPLHSATPGPPKATASPLPSFPPKLVQFSPTRNYATP